MSRNGCLRRTVLITATTGHVTRRYFSVDEEGLFWLGSQGYHLLVRSRSRWAASGGDDGSGREWRYVSLQPKRSVQSLFPGSENPLANVQAVDSFPHGETESRMPWALLTLLFRSRTSKFTYLHKNDRVEKWGERGLPKVSSYCIDYASNRAWDVHSKRSLIMAGKTVA